MHRFIGFLKYRALGIAKRGEVTNVRLRRRLFRSANNSVDGSRSDDFTTRNSDSSSHYWYKLGCEMGERYHRWIITGKEKARQGLGRVGAVLLLAVPLALGGGIAPAFAETEYINIDEQQNVTGISSPYFNGKYIQINKPTGRAFNDLGPKVYSSTGEEERGFETERPFVTQWACPDEVSHFTDCEIIITIAAPYLAKMVQVNGDHNIFSPKYNVIDKINYYVLITLEGSGGYVFKVPLLYDKSGTVLTTRIAWNSLPMNSVVMASGRCTVANNCQVASTSQVGIQSGSGGIAFRYDEVKSGSSVYDAMARKSYSVTCYSSATGSNCGTGVPDQLGSWNFLSASYLPSVSGQTVGEHIRATTATGFNLSIGGFFYSDFQRPDSAMYNNFFDCMVGLFNCMFLSNSGAHQGYAVEPFALRSPSTIQPTPRGPYDGFYTVPGSGTSQTISGQFRYDNTFCLDAPDTQPLFIRTVVVNGCGSTNPSIYGNDRVIFGFSNNNQLTSPGRCASSVGNTDYFDCSTASDYLLEEGNTTDLEGINCDVDCAPSVIDSIDYGNDADVIDPYSNPDERPYLFECISIEWVGVVYIPTGIDWNCLVISLFSPSLDAINDAIDGASDDLGTVLFPLTYAVHTYNTVLVPLFDAFDVNECVPFKVSFPAIGQQTMLPCPLDSPASGQLAEVTRVLVPWILSVTFGLFMIRKLLMRFGFASDNNLAPNTTMDIGMPDTSAPGATVHGPEQLAIGPAPQRLAITAGTAQKAITSGPKKLEQ